MVLKYKGRKKLVKTIEDALSILDDNSPIAVGSRSAFYFIGSVSDYRRDIPLIEDHYCDAFEQWKKATEFINTHGSANKPVSATNIL